MVGPEQAVESAPDAVELLAHRRRRYALQCLHEYETPMALADLADEVAVREYDAPLAELSAETVKRVYISLYHVHVPKLSDADRVRYSQERDAVALEDGSQQFERLRTYLEDTPSVTS